MKQHILEAQETAKELGCMNTLDRVLVFGADQNMMHMGVTYFKGVPCELPECPENIVAIYSDIPVDSSLLEGLSEDVIISVP